MAENLLKGNDMWQHEACISLSNYWFECCVSSFAGCEGKIECLKNEGIIEILKI